MGEGMIVRVRTKPVEKEAMQFEPHPTKSRMDGIVIYGTLESAIAIGRWSNHKANATNYSSSEGWCSEMRVCTLEGTMTASPGDWIVRGVNGEFYPIKPDIFEKTYDVLE